MTRHDAGFCRKFLHQMMKEKGVSPRSGFEHLVSLLRHLEAAGAVALDQSTHQHHGRNSAMDAGLGPFGAGFPMHLVSLLAGHHHRDHPVRGGNLLSTVGDPAGRRPIASLQPCGAAPSLSTGRRLIPVTAPARAGAFSFPRDHNID
jgi:hypothetical protein